MIPHTLQIKNFLSYGDELQTIDFTPYHLIYLSGKNGHGKSALLDAITWAIWGSARKVSTAVKADLGLLRLGQTHMIVILDFELDGNLYRVRREFNNVYGKANTQLEFGMINPETKEFIPLTDKTIRDTQLKIDHTIRLDYDAFTNSAFLRQGHANEFSEKSPKERKEILGSILGLQQFDIIKKRALEKVKDAQNKKLALQQIEEKYIQELNKKAELEQEIKSVGDQLALCEKKEQQLLGAKKDIEIQHAQLLEQQKQLDLISYKLQQHQSDLEEKKKAIRTLIHEWRTVNRRKRSVPDMGQLQTQRTQLSLSITQHIKRQQEMLTLKESALRIQEALQKKTNELYQELTIQKNSITVECQKAELTYTAMQKTCASLQEKQKELVTQIGTITPQQAKEAEAKFEKRKQAYQQFITDGKWYTSEQAGLAQKMQLTHDDDPSCPLCEQNLSIARRKFLKNKFAKQQQFIEHRIARLARITKKLKPMLIEEHAQLEQIKLIIQKSSELIQLQAQFKEANEQLSILQKNLLEHKIKLEKHIVQEKETLENHADIKQLTQEIKAIHERLSTLKYDNQQHTQDQKKFELLEKQLNELEELQHHIMQQQGRKNNISQVITETKKLKLQAADLSKEKNQFDTVTKKMQELTVQKQEYLRQTHVLVKEKEQLLQQSGSLKNQYMHLQKLQDELKKQEAIITDLNLMIDDYQTIAAATGKDGIQALLIEEAIPEIEQEANALLSKLTNNQAQIFIESLRDLKKGGSKETLDIKISDPSGIRAYELFSGGEAFRIDFALRIAISKLLARRAGTALQTLIIDEGFGSQDEEGLSHIMDAIYKIQDDFAKVIVVSHLPSMKDQFPVHFVVEKRATGSQINIVEQG
jgi:exonuclease SbcC